MTTARLEHVNFTLADPLQTATQLCHLFDWKIRWQGEAKDNGYTVHVGEDGTYLAIYSKRPDPAEPQVETYAMRGGLNHLGVVVDDLDEVERRVKAVGYQPNSHADYEPGKRFYFQTADGIEIEVVSYV